jgi:hypothetical protein
LAVPVLSGLLETAIGGIDKNGNASRFDASAATSKRSEAMKKVFTEMTGLIEVT